MILTCPECATSYFVDDSRVTAAGRTVKCSNCGARWTALPEGASAAASPPAKPAPRPTPVQTPPSPVDELVIEGPTPFVAAKPQRRPTAAKREANGKALVWAASAVVIALVVAGSIVFRAEVVQYLPASQAAYAGIGLPVSNLVIEKVRADPAFEGGRPVLSVTGQLRNLRGAAADAQPLRVSLLDRFGKPVAVKVARPLDAAVPAHAVRHFVISIVDPPASTHDLEVAFEPAAKGAAPVSVPASPVAAPPAPAASPPPAAAPPVAR
jgi:predicted Zn finger-like uncharacterized protein